MHNQLLHLGEGQHTRQKLYEENAQQGSKETVNSSDAYMHLLSKIVNPGMEMLQHVDELIGGIPEVSISTTSVEGTTQELTPMRGLQVSTLAKAIALNESTWIIDPSEWIMESLVHAFLHFLQHPCKIQHQLFPSASLACLVQPMRIDHYCEPDNEA